MTSKECLKRIDERNYLTQRERKEFLKVVRQDLSRLKKLEKTIAKADFRWYDTDIQKRKT